MSIYAVYMILFVISSYVGVTFLSWSQMHFLHLRGSEYLAGYPLTVLVTTVIIIAVSVIAYFVSRPFDKLIARIKNGGAPASEEEKELALKTYKNMNIVTIIAVVVGYVLGNGIMIGIKVAKGVLLLDPLKISFAMIQAVIFGGMNCMYTVFVLNEKLAKYRKLLQIRSLSDNDKTTTVSGSLTILVIMYICYFGINIMIVPYQILFLKGTAPIPDQFMFYFNGTLLMFGLSVLTSFYPVYVILRGIKDRISVTTDLINDLGNKSDLSSHIDISLIDDFGVLTGSINRLMKKLSEMISGVRDGTDSVTQSAKILSDVSRFASDSLIHMSEYLEQINQEDNKQNDLILGVDNDVNSLVESAKSIEESMIKQSFSMNDNSAAIVQMVANIKSVAQMTQQADSVSATLSETSEKGTAMIVDIVNAINEIKESSEKVQDIVKVIQKIASQTNLLSMNAAIEAAHAGQYGAGFAVVADEVRSLASSAATSAKDIQLQIKEMIEKIDGGVEVIAQAGTAFNKIASDVKENTDLIQTISNAMDEQRLGAEETMHVTTSVCDALGKISELTKQQASYAQNVKNAMLTVIDSAKEVSRTIAESKKASTDLIDHVNQVEKMATENLSTVDTMKNKMSSFSL